MADDTILALDLATKCGWAVLEGAELKDFGRVNLGWKTARGDRWLKFDQFLSFMIQQHNPHVLVYERVRRHIGTTAAHVYGGLLAGLERFEVKQTSIANGAPQIVPMEISAWRKATVGKGHATKDEVVQWVKDTYSVDPRTHDAAEAIAIAEAWRRTRTP